MSCYDSRYIYDVRVDRSRNDWGKGKALAPTMITTANAPVCPPETRELSGPRSGFGAHINRHPAGSWIQSTKVKRSEAYICYIIYCILLY